MFTLNTLDLVGVILHKKNASYPWNVAKHFHPSNPVALGHIGNFYGQHNII